MTNQVETMQAAAGCHNGACAVGCIVGCLIGGASLIAFGAAGGIIGAWGGAEQQA